MRRPGKRVLTAAAVLLLMLPTSMVARAQQTTAPPPGSVYPNVSWALGIVVPEGAGLQGGSRVQWGSVRNVTVQLMLPNITRPDGIIYAVLSAMTSDRVVLQVAAGAAPGRDGWLAFSWCIRGLSSGPLTYQWVLNASGPSMAPKGNISLSIFEASDVWNLRVSDSDSGLVLKKAFPSGISTSLNGGDQEVFALESYTRNANVFQTMGNLTMGALWLDGQRVVGGFYSYGQWDPNHTPVFIVGSSGSSPPIFIYLGSGAPGSFFWTYSGAWVFDVSPLAGAGTIIVVVILVGALCAFGAVVMLTRRRGGKGAQAGGSFLKT